MSPVCARCGWLPGPHRLKTDDPLPPGQQLPPQLPGRPYSINNCPGYLEEIDMTTEALCLRCAWPKQYHVLDDNEPNEEGAERVYLPRPGALVSLLDCPGYEQDLIRGVSSERSARVVLDDILAERW